MYKRKAITQTGNAHSAVTYIVVPSALTIDGVTVTTYGIGALQDGILIQKILDVSLDRKKVENVVALCNQESLEVCHLFAIAEDTAI